jgi:hypothetical protein
VTALALRKEEITGEANASAHETPLERALAADETDACADSGAKECGLERFFVEHPEMLPDQLTPSARPFPRATMASREGLVSPIQTSPPSVVGF